MPFCTQQVLNDGEVADLSNSEGERILNNVITGQYARKGLRTFLYAYKDIQLSDWEDLKEEHNGFKSEESRYCLENDLIFLAAFGLNDELRPGVNECIQKLFNGGINVRMISGDNIVTASECAIKAGILQKEELN